MFAAGPEHPLTGTVLWTVVIAGAILLVGAVLARRWRGPSAVWVRSLTALVALGVPLAFEVFAPGLTLERLGRLLMIWPVVALDALLFGIWVWRAWRAR
jgi:hypothetical protein